MILLSCKVFVSPARELTESIRHWPLLKLSLQKRTAPQGAKATPHGCGLAQTPADGYSRTFKWIVVLMSVGIRSPFRGSEIKRLTSSDMSLATEWMAVTFRATFFGPHGLEQSFWCIDAWKGDWVRLDKCSYMAPVGIEHFFDSFCFDPQRPWRAAACQALGIPSCRVSEDTHLEQLQENKFSLTPRRIPVERKASAEKSGVDQDMVGREETESDAESGWSGVSDNSSTDSSVASDQDRFDTAYEAFRDLAEGLYTIDLRRYSRGVTSEDAAGVQLLNGQEKLQQLVHLPRTCIHGALRKKVAD